MANSVMANLPPINGLYVAFFSVMMYVLFGTSRHLSLGTHGVLSIMVGDVVERYQGVLYPYQEIDPKTGTHKLIDSGGHVLDIYNENDGVNYENASSHMDIDTKDYLVSQLKQKYFHLLLSINCFY
jgi:hypothetical protein